MKKKITMLSILTLGIIVLSGCTNKQTANTQNETSVDDTVNNLVNENEESTDMATQEQEDQYEEEVAADWKQYNNKEYGFSLTFPDSWKDYQTRTGDTKFGKITAKSIKFEFKQNEPIFTISVFTKEQWSQIKGDEDTSMSARKLGSNNQYVFMFDNAQDVYASFKGRFSDLEDIKESFKTN